MRILLGTKQIRYALLAGSISLLFGLSMSALAAAPTKVQQFVYGVNLYQGKGFSGTFSPRIEKDISIVANQGNIISPKVSLVYWWPITSEYMADWETMNQSVGGSLQILKDDKVIKTLKKRDVGFYYPNGPYDDECTLLLDKKAKDEFTDFNKTIDRYYEARAKYYQDQQAYEEAITQLLEDRQAGKTVGKIPKMPKEPQPPSFYVSEPYQAFVVNLPVGSYKMRLVDSEEKTVKDSEKNLRVITPRRKGIGYDLYSESKWPEGLKADQPSNTIYFVGKKVLFFNPFKSEELTQYDFLKITKLHMPSSNNGAKDAWSWIYGDPIRNARIQLLENGKVIQSAIDQPWYVEQSGVDTARRNIVLFDMKNLSEQNQPTFRAHRLTVNGQKELSIRLVDSKGKVIPGSVRELRAVRRGDPKSLLYVSFIPLLVGISMLVIRKLSTRSAR